MKTTKLKDLKKQHEFVCNEYIKKFCNKQGLTFDEWVMNKAGYIAWFNGHRNYFNFTDIMIDINTNQPKGLIFKWDEDVTNNKTNKDYYGYILYVLPLKELNIWE